MKQNKLSPTEEKIYQLLLEKKGVVVKYEELFQFQNHPLKSAEFSMNIFLQNKDLRKKYFNALKQMKFKIQKKKNVEIKSVENLGYYLENK